MKRLIAAAFLLLAIAPAAPARGQEGKVQVGKLAPDFVVTGIDGKDFKLSSKLGKDKNIVLMFSRASW
ncbi:MAG: hypothetical protein KDB22_09940 [Planctomycetales bacterium]|nr:hypothetical protein [Planctomycetales bacterium]